MRNTLLFIVLVVFESAHAQNVFTGQILSIVDSTPIPDFYFRAGKKKIEKTDSAGVFSIMTSKNKVKLSNVFGLYGFDTILKKKKDGYARLYAVKECDSTFAEFEIRHNTPRLFCGVSFAPMASSPSDKDFEKQYNITYFIVGDFLPSSPEQMASYNKVVAQYLDKKYGTTWRQKLRPDVLGLAKRTRG